LDKGQCVRDPKGGKIGTGGHGVKQSLQSFSTHIFQTPGETPLPQTAGKFRALQNEFFCDKFNSVEGPVSGWDAEFIYGTPGELLLLLLQSSNLPVIWRIKDVQVKECSALRSVRN